MNESLAAPHLAVYQQDYNSLGWVLQILRNKCDYANWQNKAWLGHLSKVDFFAKIFPWELFASALFSNLKIFTCCLEHRWIHQLLLYDIMCICTHILVQFHSNLRLLFLHNTSLVNIYFHWKFASDGTSNYSQFKIKITHAFQFIPYYQRQLKFMQTLALQHILPMTRTYKNIQSPWMSELKFCSNCTCVWS